MDRVARLVFRPAVKRLAAAASSRTGETVRWSGNPEKNITQGPRGPRLTPRGSFEEWQETVRIAEPWSRIELGNARQLLGEMHRAGNARYAELDRTRTQLLAMLGHDLRDPLNSISMAARVLQRGELEQKLGNRILVSSGRMQRLINQVLDVSRVQNGLGLGLSRSPVDLSRLIEDIVDETQTAHPKTRYETDLPATLIAAIDSDRIAQLLSNVLNNAQHHGKPGSPISIALQSVDDRAVIRIRNEGPPIETVTAAHLYDPFKRLGRAKHPQSHWDGTRAVHRTCDRGRARRHHTVRLRIAARRIHHRAAAGVCLQRRRSQNRRGSLHEYHTRGSTHLAPVSGLDSPRAPDQRHGR